MLHIFFLLSRYYSGETQWTSPETGSEDAELCQGHVQTNEVRTESSLQ